MQEISWQLNYSILDYSEIISQQFEQKWNEALENGG